MFVERNKKFAIQLIRVWPSIRKGYRLTHLLDVLVVNCSGSLFSKATKESLRGESDIENFSSFQFFSYYAVKVTV